MLQSGGENFFELLFSHLSHIWDLAEYPEAWALALIHPIYKGGGKDKTDPASYRGIYLTNNTLKFFEGILETRLTRFTEEHDTLTYVQQGSRPNRQVHDAIYALLSSIHHNHLHKKRDASAKSPSPGTTYCAFIDFSTAYPSVHRDRLALILKDCGITGKMWLLLKENFRRVKVRVLHPEIAEHDHVDILRGLPEGSKLSPILFGIFVSELIRELRKEYPDITMPSAHDLLWLGAILYVDDMILLANSPEKLQHMINTCQRWAERSRTTINAGKTKIVVFKENRAYRRTRPAYRFTIPMTFPTPLPQNTEIITNKPFTTSHHLNKFPLTVIETGSIGTILETNEKHETHIHFNEVGEIWIERNQTDTLSLLLQEVDNFKYLGIHLDWELNMEKASELIIMNINFAHSKLAATLHSLRQHKYTATHVTLSPLMCRNLWSSCVLPHALTNIRYLRTKTQTRAVESCLMRSLKRSFQHFELNATLQLDLGIPPLDLQQAQHLVRLHFRLSVAMKGGLSSLLYMAQITQKELLPQDAIENRIFQAFHRLGIAQHYPVWADLPSFIKSPKTKNKEKAFSNYLKQIVSKVWLKETLEACPPPSADKVFTSRLQVYLSIAKKDLSRNLYKPAQYLKSLGKQSTKYVFRMRIQNSPAIPSHNPRPAGSAHQPYTNRKCTLCAASATGHEVHVLFECPLTAKLATPVIEAIKQAIPWNSYSTDQKAAVLLGSIPHTLKTKHVAMWSKTYSPQIIELAASIHAATKQAQSNKP